MKKLAQEVKCKFAEELQNPINHPDLFSQRITILAQNGFTAANLEFSEREQVYSKTKRM